MNYSIFGKRPENPAPSWTGLVLAFIIASQTFVDNSGGYPVYMVALALVASVWYLFLAGQARALIGVGFILSAGGWLTALTNPGSFDQMSLVPFLSHALLAVLLGIAAYTFAASERRHK